MCFFYSDHYPNLSPSVVLACRTVTLSIFLHIIVFHASLNSCFITTHTTTSPLQLFTSRITTPLRVWHCFPGLVCVMPTWCTWWGRMKPNWTCSTSYRSVTMVTGSCSTTSGATWCTTGSGWLGLGKRCRSSPTIPATRTLMLMS